MNSFSVASGKDSQVDAFKGVFGHFGHCFSAFVEGNEWVTEVMKRKRSRDEQTCKIFNVLVLFLESVSLNMSPIVFLIH